MKQLKQKPYLTYALDTNGKLVHVDCVPRGLACKCLCPIVKVNWWPRMEETVRFITLHTLMVVIVLEQ